MSGELFIGTACHKDSQRSCHAQNRPRRLLCEAAWRWCRCCREFVIFLIPSPCLFPIPLPVQRLSIFLCFPQSHPRQCSTFLLARAARSRKSTASVQGEGQGEGSSHI